MKKFAFLAAVAAVSAVAVPASAAQLIRISLVNKSAAQIDAEIRTAATTVCADLKASASVGCVNDAISNANRQLNVIKARNTKPAPRAEAVTVMRVSLKGKSQDQIQTEIKLAAETVCKATKPNTNSDYRFCVGSAIRSAKAQLQAANVSSRQDA